MRSWCAFALAGVVWLGACGDRAIPAKPAAAPAQTPAPASAPRAAAAATGAQAASPAGRQASSVAAELPADVSAFKQAREQCDHFRGEEAYDSKRAAELARKLETYCRGTDGRLAELRKKYADNPRIIAVLAPYESQVE